jgi:hypothetical protein
VEKSFSTRLKRINLFGFHFQSSLSLMCDPSLAAHTKYACDDSDGENGDTAQVPNYELIPERSVEKHAQEDEETVPSKDEEPLDSSRKRKRRTKKSPAEPIIPVVGDSSSELPVKKFSANQSQMCFYLDRISDVLIQKRKRFEKDSHFDLTILDEHVQNPKVIVPFFLQLLHFINSPTLVVEAVGNFGGPPSVKTTAGIERLGLIERNLKKINRQNSDSQEKLAQLYLQFGTSTWFTLPQSDKRKIEAAQKNSKGSKGIKIMLMDVELCTIPDKNNEGKTVDLLLGKYRYEPLVEIPVPPPPKEPSSSSSSLPAAPKPRRKSKKDSLPPHQASDESTWTDMLPDVSDVGGIDI